MTMFASWCYFIAPADAPEDRYRAGFDGNFFATAEEARAEIPLLAEATGTAPEYWEIRCWQPDAEDWVPDWMPGEEEFA